MHDRLDHYRMNDDDALTAALRALPAETPPQDAWTRLASRTRRRRNVRRVLWTGLPAALAAGIALAVAWPHATLHQAAPAATASTQSPASRQPAQPAQPAAIPASQTVIALQTSSAQWQAWVQNLDRNGAPLDGRALASAVALQDRIGLIDLQLSATRNPASTADLWQQRITMLQQLGLLHLQPYLVAEQTRSAHANTL